jgi:Cu/Zn superoxide dismutase
MRWLIMWLVFQEHETSMRWLIMWLVFQEHETSMRWLIMCLVFQEHETSMRWLIMCLVFQEHETSMRWLIMWLVFQERRAVVALFKGQEIVGGINFVQEQDSVVVRVSGIVSGLTKGNHGFHVHEKGNISNDCIAAGAHFNPEQV